MRAAERFAQYLMNNVRSPEGIDQDTRDGMCMLQYQQGRMISATYRDGRVFYLDGDKFHTRDMMSFLKMLDVFSKIDPCDPVRETDRTILAKRHYR